MQTQPSCFLYNNCNHKDCDSEFCVRRFKMEYLYDHSCLSESQRQVVDLRLDESRADLDAYMRLRDIALNITSFVERGKNLYLHSYICGNGKTSWAVRLIQEYFNKIWAATELRPRALFISVPRFLLALKDQISNKNDYADFVKANVLEADLVVWDDIAAKIGTEFELNHLLSIIDARLIAGKSNIYTSNLGPKEMSGALMERLASRVCNLSMDIQLVEADKRKLSTINSEA